VISFVGRTGCREAGGGRFALFASAVRAS